MALMLGNVLPFGITKDMKHVFLLIDYWQQATQTDMEFFFALLLRHYCGQKWLPKEQPCTMRYGIYLKDPESLICMDTVAEYRGFIMVRVEILYRGSYGEMVFHLLCH